MPSCSVADCFNANKAKVNRKKDLQYHRFPIRNKDLSKKWVDMCNRKDNVNITTARLCSDHFLPLDYVEAKMNKRLGLQENQSRKLKLFACPSVFPNRNRFDLSNNKDSILYQEENKRKEMVKQILIENEQQTTSKIDYCQLYKNVIKDFQTFKNHNSYQEQQVLAERVQMENTIRSQQEEIARLRSGSLNQESKIIPKLASTSAKTSQSGIQYAPDEKKLINGDMRVNWNVETIVKNLRIRSISKKAYEMSRIDRNVPRPSVRTLQRWVKTFNCQEGLLTDILDILKEKSKEMNVISRLCVVLFDEMSVDSKVVYDSSLDKVYQNSKAQVVMIRGLFSDWKQPIFYNFDTNVTKDLLLSIIVEVEKVGFLVCACVSDLGIENQKLWKELNICEENVKFVNPFDQSRNVFVFADIPHCLKNMRNHVIDDGVILADSIVSPEGKILKPNTIIDKSTMMTLLSKNGNELDQINPNLTLQSLNISGPERMKVKPAAQFFSRRTSKLAKKVFPENPSISEFFENFNNGFDLLNSRVPVHEENMMKSGLGSHFEIQKQELLKFRHLLSTMRFRTKSGNQTLTPLPSQLGFMLAVDAVLLLFDELQRLYRIEYLLTSRLTQDILESFFSLIRSLGGPNTHPSPPLFRFRFRLVILGSKLKNPRGSNTSVDVPDFSFISTELIRKTKMDKIAAKNSPELISADYFEEDEHAVESVESIEEAEEEPIRQLAVYLWPKLKKLHECVLTTSTTKTNSSETILNPSFSRPSEDHFQPCDDFVDHILACERGFSKYFPIFKSKNMASLKISNKILCKLQNGLNSKLVHQFVRIRMRMKVKFLNNQINEQKMNRRNKKKVTEFVKSWIQKKKHDDS